jgi:hypothetical protein
MDKKANIKKNDLPEELINLVEHAMESHVTKEDFKKFIKEEKEKRGYSK